jgi:hypothetical protein
MNGLLRLSLVLAGSAMLLPAQPALARGDPTERPDLREGTHVFRRILYDRGIEPLEDFEQLNEDPKRSILIVLGKTSILGNFPGGLRRFLRRGGAVLLATDRGIRHPGVHAAVRKIAGVRINKQSVVCPNPALCYKGLDYCPFLLPAPRLPGEKEQAFNLFQLPPNVAGSMRVATNVPSYLLGRDPLPKGISAVADLPPKMRIDRPKPPPEFDSLLLFAVGGNVGSGRILVLADHSIFINEMMLPTDNHNVEFVFNCVNWLQDGEQRDRALFLEEGVVRTKFQIPLKSLSIPPSELAKALVANRNEVLTEVGEALGRWQGRTDINHLILDGLWDLGLSPAALHQLGVVLGTLLLLLYGAYRITARARHRQDWSVPLLAQAVGRNLPASSILEQRHSMQLQVQNLWETARDLTRRWFAEAGMAVTASSAPPAVVRGGWWRRWRQGRRLRRLWRLAQGVRPVRVTPRGLNRLQAELTRLRVALKDGSVRLGSPHEGAA